MTKRETAPCPWRSGVGHTCIGALVAALLFASAGCVVVGSGERTVVRAVGDPSLAERIPHLVVPEHAADSRALVVAPDGSPTSLGGGPAARFEDYREYMTAKYGRADFEAASLDVSFRDLARMPPLAPELQATVRAEIVKVLNDSKLTKEQRQERVQALKATLLNSPDTDYSTVLHGYDSEGREIYRYFPRLQIDLSADVQSPSSLDRFSHIALVVRLPEEGDARFIDLQPKAADMVEFTRGQLKQESQLAAKAEAGRSVTGVGARTRGDDSSSTTRGLTLGANLTYSLSETLTRELTDGLERRTVTVLDDGRTLFVQLRAIREKRIGGTYEFDVMLEIPAAPVDVPAGEGGGRAKRYTLQPRVTQITPEVHALGVVRHVYDRGMTGVFRRVPETENDDVYEQVVLKTIRDRDLWTFNQVPWTRPYVERASKASIKVATNHDGARFVLVDGAGKVLASGKGVKDELEIATAAIEKSISAQLRFLPVAYTGEGGAQVLRPSPDRIDVTIAPGSSESFSFYSEYSTTPRR